MYKLCKTEQSAARQRELEQKLAEMMNTHRYEEINVSDFCSYVGIPRKAFYRYFSSKDGALYALLDHTLLEYESFRTPHFSGKKRSMLRELESYFQFWKGQKLLLDALAHSGLGGILVERAIANGREDMVLRKILPDDTAKTREHIYRFSMSGLMIMMVDWHRGGYQESCQEMAQIAARLISQPLFPTAREYI